MLESLYTLLLFTWTDYKTILLPITIFACATAPLSSGGRLLQGVLWIFCHQLMCNVSNQARALDEDAVNRPWRPVPSGRISARAVVLLRWCMVAVCLAVSAPYGAELMLVTFCLFATTYLYDELGCAAHYLTKNACNIGAYTTLEVGAVKIIGGVSALDQVSISAIAFSGFVIFTTIQAQDFPDIEGDAALGRVTLPILAPEFSRTVTLVSIVSWSLCLSWYWDIGLLHRAMFVGLGVYVGHRYYRLRTINDDKRSYVLFNLWLMFAHLLPLHARTGLLKY